MKKVIAILLSCVLLLVGCSQNAIPYEMPINTEHTQSVDETVEQVVKKNVAHNNMPEDEQGNDTSYTYEVDFESLDNKALQRYVKDTLYNEIVAQLDNEAYFVENISTVYISQEYIDELAYNSKANIYFGYTLEEIAEVFQGTHYVFTVSEEGDTVVIPFEAYDDTYEQVLTNVAIGSGVILICVTVSLVTAGTGAPAVSMIFATSAKSATAFALSSASLGGVVEGIITGVETGDMSEALKAAKLAGSEGFKWGAITGAITGGAGEGTKYVKAMKALKGNELKGLKVQQAATIQMESGYPVDVIKQFHSMEEYNVFKAAKLKNQIVGESNALVRTDIDLSLIDEFEHTNLERMKLGLPALDENGKSYELHHIGQEANATLAILTQTEHDNVVLHGFKAISEIDRDSFATQRKRFWKAIAELLEKGDI